MPRVPWSTVVKGLPALMAAADALISLASKGRDQAAPAIRSLEDRVAALEEQQRTAADLLKRLADQVNALAAASEASSILLRRTMLVAAIGTGLALVACIMGVWLWVRG